jgi:hypothetical protein
MRIKWRSPCIILAALVLMLLPTAALAADVDVIVEGAYNATALDVYLYATINADNLCSYGVKITYDKTKLNTPTATKNVSVWYFGSASPGNTYMDPAVDTTAGTITFIGGKLDTGTPTAGVTGTRVLLGKVSFTRPESSVGLGTSAESYFGITAALGKASPYDNFVTTGGVKKDSLTGFSVKVRERGDANGDGLINSTDYVAIRNLIGATNPPPYSDCNGDGSVNSSDYVCVRNKLQ